MPLLCSYTNTCESSSIRPRTGRTLRSTASRWHWRQSSTGKLLREHGALRVQKGGAPVRCVAVEPADALHGLEGLKHLASSLVPAIHDGAGYDETRRVTTEDGWDMADRLAAEEAVHVGHSSGAAVFAAVSLARELHARGEGGCIVTVACDRGDRYFAPARWEKRYLW